MALTIFRVFVLVRDQCSCVHVLGYAETRPPYQCVACSDLANRATVVEEIRVAAQNLYL